MFLSIRKHPFYKPLLWVSSLILFAFLIWLGSSLVTNPKWFMGDDYVEYWAAGRLNLTGGNPYDPGQLHPLELQSGVIQGEAVMMWNPPWLLTLVMPFGALGYGLSRTLWLLLNIFLIAISLNQIWKLYGGDFDLRWLAIAIGFTFAPILDGLKKGQTSVLLLFGVVGFLYFAKQKKWWLAGISLALLAVKPHILYLYLLAVLFWVVDQKQWKIISGLLIAMITASAVAWLVNPDVIQQYLFAIANYPPADWATPTIGGILRILFGTERFWLQFLPAFFGITWLIYYWFKQRKEWDWLVQTPILILVSTLTAAYGWTWDQSVSIIAILSITTLILPFQKNRSTLIIIGTYLVINGLAIFIRGNQFWTSWFASALLIWFLTAHFLIRSKSGSVNSQDFH